MRTNPFYDAWLFLIGNTGDHEGSGVGPLLTLLFALLLVASIGIAVVNLRRDLAQRTKEHLATWFMRVMIGAMWYQGSLWKLPLPVSGGFKFWTESITNNAAFDVHKWIATHVFIPFLAVIDPLVYLTELALAISFMLGFLVRPMAIIGMLFVAHLWLGLYRHPDEWPWTYVFLIFVQGCFLVGNGGKSLGLDGLLTANPVGPFAGDGVMARLYRRIA
jgi:hypothetical protein